MSIDEKREKERVLFKKFGKNTEGENVVNINLIEDPRSKACRKVIAADSVSTYINMLNSFRRKIQ